MSRIIDCTPIMSVVERRRGYYSAVDKILNHINTIDSSEMTTAEFRKKICHDIGDMCFDKEI